MVLSIQTCYPRRTYDACALVDNQLDHTHSRMRPMFLSRVPRSREGSGNETMCFSADQHMLERSCRTRTCRYLFDKVCNHAKIGQFGLFLENIVAHFTIGGHFLIFQVL